jgi:integrase
MPPGLRRRNKNWYINYYDLHGRRHWEKVGPSVHRALKARASRIVEIESGRFGLRKCQALTLREFVDGLWQNEVVINLKPSTSRSYKSLLKYHLLPEFGDYPLSAITRPTVKSFIARKLKTQRRSYSIRRPNPNRPNLSRKTIFNSIALLTAIMESAATDYNLLPANPIRGALRKRNFPVQKPGSERVRVLEPEEFKKVVENLRPPVLQAVLFATFTGARWSEQTALQIEEDVDFRRNRLQISRSLYKRVAQTPKTRQSVRDIVISPMARKILESVPRKAGFVFSEDGTRSLGNGNWIKQQWRQAQIRAGVKSPIRWHDLRHQFVSFLIAIGKHPKFIASQAGHASAGFTMDRYGHLFETITATPTEWPEDLLWPGGVPFDLSWHHLGTITEKTRLIQTGEQTSDIPSEPLAK